MLLSLWSLSLQCSFAVSAGSTFGGGGGFECCGGTGTNFGVNAPCICKYPYSSSALVVVVVVQDDDGGGSCGSIDRNWFRCAGGGGIGGDTVDTTTVGC